MGRTCRRKLMRLASKSGGCSLRRFPRFSPGAPAGIRGGVRKGGGGGLKLMVCTIRLLGLGKKASTVIAMFG